MHSKTWPSIYPGLSTLPLNERSNIQAWVLREDHRLILSVSTNKAVLSHIIQHGIKSAADYIRSNQLSYLNADEFVEYLCKRSFAGVDQNPPSPDVTRPTPTLRDEPPYDETLATNSRKAVASRIRGEAKGGGGARAPRAAKKS